MFALPLPRRAALLAATLAAAGVAAGSAAGVAAGSAGAIAATPHNGTGTGTGTTTIGGNASPPTPHLAVTWTVLERRCRTVTRRERVHVHHHVKIEKKQVRQCGPRAIRTRSDVHLGWKQHGVAYVHLTLAGKPIAAASVVETSKLAHHAAVTSTLTTDAHGRVHVGYGGPDRTITLTYTPAGGKPITRTAHVSERAHLSFFVGHLRAGHRGEFTGIVFGGHIPQGLYIQFYYLSASAGWQPFASLASVARHSGHWHASIKIPTGAAGYRYKIRATVVPSAAWPFARTTSRVISRIVS